MEEKDNLQESSVLGILDSIGLGGMLNDPNDDTEIGLAHLLSISDDSFDLLKPILLEEFEKALNNPNDQYFLTMSLQQNGLNLEQLQLELEQIYDIVDKELDAFSESKRDFVKQLFMFIQNSISNTLARDKRIINVPIQKLNSKLKLPEYAKVGDSGLDVFSPDEYDIEAGTFMTIWTGLKVALPLGYELQVRPKSGLSSRTYLRIANSPGTIDSGFRDEIGIIVENTDPPIKDIEYDFDEKGRIIITSILHGSPIHIDKGQKIAQLVLMDVPKVAWTETDSVENIGENRGGGFGHTGK